MFKKGDYVKVNDKIHTHDQYVPPRHCLVGRCGIIDEEHDGYPSVQFYRNSRKDPPVPMKVPKICLDKITKKEYIICILEGKES
jgi:hypothetical protein